MLIHTWMLHSDNPPTPTHLWNISSSVRDQPLLLRRFLNKLIFRLQEKRRRWGGGDRWDTRALPVDWILPWSARLLSKRINVMDIQRSAFILHAVKKKNAGSWQTDRGEWGPPAPSSHSEAADKYSREFSSTSHVEHTQADTLFLNPIFAIFQAAQRSLFASRILFEDDSQRDRLFTVRMEEIFFFFFEGERELLVSV